MLPAVDAVVRRSDVEVDPVPVAIEVERADEQRPGRREGPGTGGPLEPKLLEQDGNRRHVVRADLDRHVDDVLTGQAGNRAAPDVLDRDVGPCGVHQFGDAAGDLDDVRVPWLEVERDALVRQDRTLRHRGGV